MHTPGGRRLPQVWAALRRAYTSTQAQHSDLNSQGAKTRRSSQETVSSSASWVHLPSESEFVSGFGETPAIPLSSTFAPSRLRCSTAESRLKGQPGGKVRPSFRNRGLSYSGLADSMRSAIHYPGNIVFRLTPATNSPKLMKAFLLLTALSLIVAPLVAEADESAAERDQRMAWFRDARFGLFIHWGVYSVPAGEWNGKTGYGEWFLEETKMPVSQYEKFAGQFNPVQFDAKEWVRLAKQAGMKYIVITSKHHDGFGMFRSDQTDWCIKSTPFQRDPLKELADACRAAGIKLCFYHSIMDWHHPDWGNRRAWNDKATGTPDMDRYTAYMKAQLKELLTRYGPIGILWFDGEWESP